MSLLISCVGDSDPIRNHRDGPALHIARMYEPEKIILIHSERSISKHSILEQAMKSIEGYDPTIEIAPLVIKNSDVFQFDRMFDLLYPVINSYCQKEADILLNLSSGTPQIISAMFSINRISNHNVRAFQVTTPLRSSNQGTGHESLEDVDALISLNKDQQAPVTNRVIEDHGEKFNQILMIRTFKDLIDQYDYEGAYRLMLQHKLTSKKKRAIMIKKIEDLLNLVKFQSSLPEVEVTAYNDQEKLLLNAFLLLQLQNKRLLISEVLIRSKNLAEAISEYYLSHKYPDLMICRNEKWFLNKMCYHELHHFLDAEAKNASGKSDVDIVFNLDHYLSLPVYVNIIKYLEPDSSLLNHFNKVVAINHLRNKVAHGFEALNPKEVKGQHAYAATKELIKQVLHLDDHWFDYFKNTNEDLVRLLS